ncbi:hypothetical protein COOONC_26160, partial [Cooperia oncophora]
FCLGLSGSFIQVVDSGENILAYYAPCAPANARCLKFSSVKLAFNGEVGGVQIRPVFVSMIPKNLPHKGQPQSTSEEKGQNDPMYNCCE